MSFRTGDGPDGARLERVLSKVYGQHLEIVSIERLAPWFVARACLAVPGGGQASVIVKWLRQHPENFRVDRQQLVTERAALEFVGKLGLAVAPRLLAFDDGGEFLVLEDLAPRVALFDLLAEGDERALEGLDAFARSMGTLHAASASEFERYHDWCRSFGAGDPDRARRHIDGFSWDWALPDVDWIGLDTSRGAEADMHIVRETLTGESPFLALSNGDAGANNFFVDDRDGRIIDWEFAGYRHALIDAASLWVPGPIWMTIAPAMETGVDLTYRAALAQGVPAAGDDRFELEMAAACLVKAIERLERLPKLDARPPEHESRRQMIATLEAAARAARHFGRLPHLADWTASAATALRRRWPDADREFPDAYTTRQ